jgi:hypothetical protein
VSCAICHERKEKRFCPAVHAKICPQCCGEQREVTLDCPSECPYLQQARQHEHPREEKLLDREALFPEVEIPEQFLYEREHLIVGLSYALVRAVRGENPHGAQALDGHAIDARTIADRDLIAALTSVVKSYQTLVQSNLIYEQASANLAHQRVARELQTAIKEFRETEQKHLGYSRLRDAEILQALVFLLRMGMARTSGRPKSRAYIDFLSSQFQTAQSPVATPQEAGSRIILP